MARLALVVLAFGLSICVYAESDEHQKHGYQADSLYSRSKGHYDSYRNKGRHNQWEDRHGYNKNNKGYYKHQKGQNISDYRYHVKGNHHGYEKSRGSGCDCDHNKGGYSNYKGSKGGSYNHGYNSRGSNSEGYYRRNSGVDYNRGDYGSGHINNFNHKYKGHGNVDYNGYEKSKGNGYDSDHNNGGYPSYKGPKGGRYDPGYDRRDGNYRRNSGEDYNQGDYGSSKNDNFYYVQD